MIPAFTDTAIMCEGRWMRVSAHRKIDWDGFMNARDLGGLPTSSGGFTRSGSIVRSGILSRATEAGWRSAYDAGIRTVVDLRNDDELSREVQAAPKPVGITTVQVPIDDVEDVTMWDSLNREGLSGTPLYFAPFMEQKPKRCAAAIRAIANAAPGGILFHCGAGRDRTGLVAMLLLSLVGVTNEAIAEDYLLSAPEVSAILAADGRPDQNASIERVLREKGTTVREAMLDLTTDFDAEAYLLHAGMEAKELQAVRARLIDVIH